MIWLVWIALGVGAAATLGSIAFAVARGLGLWRQLKATAGAAERELTRVVESADAVARHAEGLSDGAGRMEQSLSRLSRSRQRLSVLLSAWSDVRASLGRVTAVYPRK